MHNTEKRRRKIRVRNGIKKGLINGLVVRRNDVDEYVFCGR